MRTLSVYLVGCGGVGSYLAPVLYRELSKFYPGSTLRLVDRDGVEAKNVERQQFAPPDVGKPKAVALAAALQALGGDVEVIADVDFVDESYDFAYGSLVFCAVDNHPARRYTLEACDRSHSTGIFCANGEYGADAYIYRPVYRDHPEFDPRRKFPEILTDTSDDPTRPGCNLVDTGTPQTATANLLAAALAMNLFAAFYLGKPVSREFEAYLPYYLSTNRFGASQRKTYEQAHLAQQGA